MTQVEKLGPFPKSCDLKRPQHFRFRPSRFLCADLSLFPLSSLCGLNKNLFSTMDMMFYMKKNKEKDAVKKQERQQRDELKNVIM